MFSKKNIFVHLLSLCVLFIGFVLCRYEFFYIHGNIGLPACLFIIGTVSVVISFFFKGKIIPICTAFAYIVGFIVGAVFQTNGVDVGGGTTNNLWIIWIVVFACLTLVGIIYEKFIGYVKKATK